MLIQFSVRYRLNPTSDLRGLPTSLTTCVVFINQARSIHNSREKTAIATTQFDEKPTVYLPS